MLRRDNAPLPSRESLQVALCRFTKMWECNRFVFSMARIQTAEISSFYCRHLLPFKEGKFGAFRAFDGSIATTRLDIRSNPIFPATESFLFHCKKWQNKNSRSRIRPSPSPSPCSSRSFSFCFLSLRECESIRLRLTNSPSFLSSGAAGRDGAAQVQGAGRRGQVAV